MKGKWFAMKNKKNFCIDGKWVTPKGWS